MYRRQQTKSSPQKQKQKGQGLSEEASQIAEEREVKSKGERERYIQLNADFQRIARRDNKAFCNEQCIKLEEKTEGERLEIS